MPILKLLILLSFRNLIKRKTKTMIVGTIIFFGTLFVVVGTAFLDSVKTSMTKSITSSVSGHLQIYSSNAKDDFAIYGGMSMGDDDIGNIPDFQIVKQVLGAHPNIKAIVPMGIRLGYLVPGSELDRVLANLRDAVHQQDQERISALSEQVKGTIGQMISELKIAEGVVKTDKERQTRRGLLTRAASPAFWRDFQKNPLEALEFLDVKIAPLNKEGMMFYFRNLGTDLTLFAREFDQFELAGGQMVPEGKPGFLISERFMELYVKNRAAFYLDLIHRDITEREKTIADDPEVSILAERLKRQYKLITFQLTPAQAGELENKLNDYLSAPEGDLNQKVQQFLTVNDQNFLDRYEFFYTHIAPMIDLYNLKPGDIVTIRGYTQSGYAKAVNVKFYGTFHFKGMEKSEIAGAFNLLDIMTFRELLGLMTSKKEKELDAIRASVGDRARDILQEDIEAALFSEQGDGQILVSDEQRVFNEFDYFKKIEKKSALQNEEAVTFTQEQIDRGVALNAAVILKDARLLKKTRKEIEKLIEDHQLNLQVINWQQASGIIGQFAVVIRIVLYTAVLIIYLVALVIINNSMIIATMERVKEIGTMRAIGAQKTLILGMFVIETLSLGLLSGIPGAFAGAGLVTYLGSKGIPAAHDVLIFLFGGPRFYPVVGGEHLLIGFGVILLVSIFSTLYPAIIATRIQPVVAMQEKE